MAVRSSDGVRLITKYPNRRLYDTETSRYITLEELAALIQEGVKIKVQDAREGTDLTRQVLTQVLLEEQERLDMLPVELLHLIIRAQGTAAQAPLTRFLSHSFTQFASLGDTLYRNVSDATHRTPGAEAAQAAMHQAAQAGAGFLKKMSEAFPQAVWPGAPTSERPPMTDKGASPPPPSPPPPPSEEKPSDDASREAQRSSPDADLHALRHQMDNLLKRLRGNDRTG